MASPTPGRASEARKWTGHVEVVASPATKRSSGGVELFLPLSQSQDSLVFVDARLSASSDSELFGNFGMALRRIIQSDYIIGASVFLDHLRSEHKRSYYGVTLGVEALTETLEARVNFHAPLTDEKLLAFRPAVAGGTLSLQNLRLVEQLGEAGFIRHEIPHYGVEGEVGVKLPIGLPDDSALRVFGGGYHYWASGMEDITGVSGRIEFETRNLFGDSLPGARLTLAGLVRHDDVRDTEFGGEVRLRLPFGAAPPSAEGNPRSELTPLERRMTNRIIRQTEIVTRTRTRVIGSGTGGTRLAINPETGEPYGRILFADGAGTAGAGTPGDPTTLDDAVDRAGVDGVVIAEGSAGPIGTGGIRLAEGMALLGGGTALPVVLAGGSITQFELGTTAATIQGIGAVNVIRLAEGTRVENITITGGQTAIAGYGYGNVVLKDVAVSGTGGNSIEISNATGPLNFQNVSIAGSGGHGLVVNGAAGPVSIEGLVVSGSAGHGISAVNTANLSIQGASIGGVGGDGVNIVNNAGTSLLSANQVVVSSAARAGFSVDGSGGGTTIVTSFADNVVQQAGAGGVLFETVSFDADPEAAGIQAVPGGDLLIGSLATPGGVGGDGLHLNNVLGAVSFGSLQIGNAGGTGLFVRDAGGKAGSFSLSSTGGAVTTTGGTAIDLDPVIVNVTLLSIDASGGMHGLLLDNVSGTFTVTGPVTIADVTDVGLAILDSSGAFSFGDTTVSAAGGAGILADNVSGTVAFGATAIGDVGGSGISIADSAADVTFTGMTTVNAAGGAGVALMDTTGTIAFDVLSITNPGSAGINIGGTIGGPVTFAGLDIALQTGNTTGLDLSGATINADIAAGDFDLTSTTATGTVGVDLVGTTGTGTVTLGTTAPPFDTGPSSTIAGVDQGVLFSSATNLNFIFGDGEAVVDVGSSIDATTPIAATDALPVNGLYNFLDAQLIGDTSNLSAGNVFFADNVPGGAGTAADPGDLAGAEASGADIVVLVNNGTMAIPDILDAATAGGSLDLADGQSLLSFHAGDTIEVTGAPPSFLLTGIATEIANPNPGSGAPALTTSVAGGNVVVLGAAGNTLSGLILDGAPAGAARGIKDNGTGATNTTIADSVIRNFGVAGIEITPSTNTRIDTVDFLGNASDVVLNATNTTIANVTSTNATGTAIQITNATATTTLTNVSVLNAGGMGIAFTNAGGTVTAANVDVSNTGGAGVNIAGGTASFTFDAASSITDTTGASFSVDSSTASVTFAGSISHSAAGTPAVGIVDHDTGTITFTAGSTITDTAGTGLHFDNADSIATYNFNGTTTFSGSAGIAIVGGSSGTFSFGTGTAITDPTGTAFRIDDSPAGNVAFDGTIAQTNAARAIHITDKTGGSVTFGGMVTANTGTETAVDLTDNAGATIAFTGGLDIVTTSGMGFNATGGGTVSVAATAGDESIRTTTGTALNLSGVTIGAGGLNFDSIAVDGAATGIGLTNVGSTGGGAMALGSVDLQNVTSRGVDIETALGAALAFADLVIGLNGANAVAFDLNGAALSAPITADDFDVSNAGAAGATIGVDLRGTTGAQIVRLGDADPAGNSSTIVGVHTGVFLNTATNAVFTFGDGERVQDIGSLIDAVVGIDATDAPALGIYNFEDVQFPVSPGNGFGIANIFFVDSDGAVGDGTGRDGDNPMTLAAAEAAAGEGDIIVLINNGNAITAENSNGDDTFNLANSQKVLGFANGSIDVDITSPGNILLSTNVIVIDDPTNGGAATMTSVAGADVITLGANANRIDGFILDGQNVAERGIKDNGGGASNTTISNMEIRNFAVAGVEITPSNNTTIDTVDFSGNASDVILNATNTTIRNVTSTGATGTAIQITDAADTTTLSNVTIADAGGSGIAFANPGGTVTATNVDVTDTGAAAVAIDSGMASFTFDAASSITQGNNAAALSVSGGHTGTFGFAGTIGTTDGTGLQFDNADGLYDFTGTATLSGSAGIAIVNGSAGTFNFGAGTTISNTTGTSFSVESSTASVTFAGTIAHSQAGAAAVSIADHDTGTITFAAGSSITDTAGTGLQFDNADSTATYNFNGTATLSGTAGIAIANSAGTFNFGANTAVANPTGTAFSLVDSSADVTFDGTIVQNNGFSAVAASGNTGTATFNGAVTANITNNPAVANAIDLVDNAGATFSFTGGLDIFLIDGIGFNATGGGTLAVTGGSNVIEAQSAGATANAIRLTDMMIGAAGVSFSSVTVGDGASTVGEGIVLDNTSGGAVDFGDVHIERIQTTGIRLSNVANAIGFNGTTTLTTALAAADALLIENGAASASVSFADLQTSFLGGTDVRLVDNAGTTMIGGMIDNTAGDALTIDGEAGTTTIAAAITSTGTGRALDIGATGGLTGGTATFTGPVTDTNGGGIRIQDVGAGASLAFDGATSITNPAMTAVDLSNTAVAGMVSFANLDIALGTDATTGVDLSGTTVNGSIDATDFDLTSTTATGTTGVNLVDTTGTGTVQLGDPDPNGEDATIIGVETGVLFSSATDFTFIFGDGEAAVDVGSSIDAVRPIGDDGTGLPANGIYNFLDVNLVGDTTNLSAGNAFFVDHLGAGDGSAGNPGSLAGAELSGADFIVLVNQGTVGAPDTIDAASADQGNAGGNDTLDLADDQQLLSFRDGDTIDVGGGAPASFLLTGITPGEIANPNPGSGAPILTTSDAGGTVVALGASGNLLDGLILDGDGVAGRGVRDNGLGATDTTIVNSTIRNFTVAGIEITPSTNTTIDNVDFDSNAADAILNAADTTISNVTSTGATGIAFQIAGASGTTTLTDIAISGAAGGILFTGAGGTVNASNVDISGASPLTITGGTANFTFDADSSITTNSGAAVDIADHATGTFGFAGTIDATGGTGLQFDNADGIYNFTATTTLAGGDAGIDIVGGSGGTFSFGANTSITHNAAGDAFNLADSNANVTFSGSITANAGRAVNIDNHDAGTITFQTGAISANGASAQGIRVVNSNGGTVNFNSQTTLSTQGNNAVTLTDNNGKSINFSPASTGLAITTTTGIGFSATGGGTVNVGGAGNTIASGAGTALNLSGVATSSGIGFSTVNKNGTGSGIVLANVTGAGAVNVTGGSIQNTNANAVSIAGGTAAFSHGGTITNTAGRSVNVTNYGGTATFSGAISDSGQGINLQNNTGTVTFSGGLTLNTTTNTAFNATGGGGTVNVRGAGNTVTTTTGTGVNISGTTIGGDGVTFRSINVNGAANGIVLNNTGAGAFTVSGDGTLARNASGGTITGTTGDGVSLTNANNVVLRQMNIVNAGGEAIQSSGGGNFTFSAITIQNPASHGWQATNLGGTNRLDHGSLVTQINGVSTQGVTVSNTNTNLTSLTIDDVTFSNSTTSAAALFFESNGNSVMTVNVQNGSEFTGLFGAAIQGAAGNSAGSTGTLNTNITSSIFRDAAANGLNHILLTAGFAATHNVNVTGNTLDTLTQTAIVNAGVIQLNISGTTNGATLQGTVANNHISNTGGRGAIFAFVDPANTSTNLPNKLDLTISGNTIDNVPGEVDVISINIQNAGNVAAAGTHEVTIDGNIMGQGAIAGTTAGNLGERQVFEIVVVDGETLNILVNNNLVTANNNQDLFRAAAFQVPPDAAGNLNLTLTNNNFTLNNAAGDNVVIEAIDGNVCADVQGNTLAGAATNIDLTNLSGTFRVRQLSAADMQAQNPGSTVVVTNDPVIFNQGACPVPTP